MRSLYHTTRAGYRWFKARVSDVVERLLPGPYRRWLVWRHPGLVLKEDPRSDVREITEANLRSVRAALSAMGLRVLDEMADPFSPTFLVAVSRGDVARLVMRLLDEGLRVGLHVTGARGRTVVTGRRQLRRVLRRFPESQIHTIRAGFTWFSGRGKPLLGWYSAAAIAIYDPVGRKRRVYRARSGTDVPPVIDPEYRSPNGVSAKILSGPERLDVISFPIDVVYTWVDGDDPAWQQRKAERMQKVTGRIHAAASSATRYKSRDELRYSLRSLYYYAPWVRNIYLVTDQQVPGWLDADKDQRIRVIDHRELFPDPEVLPTFNSHAIESVLHCIPGLSDNFIYMNDDVFFSSKLHPEAFFETNGIARTFLSRAMIPYCAPADSHIASEWGAFNANELLYARHGRAMPYKTKHTPLPLKRTLLEELETRFPEHFAALRARPFRTRDDLAPTSTLHTFFGIVEGHVVRGDIRYAYVDLSRKDLYEALRKIEHTPHALVYCLNDTEVHDGFDWFAQEATVRGFLERMYPYMAPWERDDSCP